MLQLATTRNKKRMLVFILFLLVSFGSLPLVYSLSNHATILTDEELDNIYAGGFDFDLAAAYAFRAAVVRQRNIAAINGINGNIKNPQINNVNSARVINVDGSGGSWGGSSQANVSAVVAQSGDIVGANVSSGNVLQTVAYNSPIAVSVDVSPGNVTPQVDVIPVDVTAVDVTPIDVTPLDVTPVDVTPAEVTQVDLVPAVQTNVAALVALEGDIKQSTINNFNVANIKDETNCTVAVENNIAVVVAGGSIESTGIKNTSIASVNDVPLSNATTVEIPFLSNGKLTKFKFRKNSSARQRNLTLAISGYKKQSMQKIKLNKIKKIIKNVF